MFEKDIELSRENNTIWFDSYDETYKPITLPSISFMFIEIKFIHYHSCVTFVMKFINICNDSVNYDEIIIK